MPLNEELDWGSVGAIVTDSASGTTVANAFQLMFGMPSKDLLPKGMKIYKFNSYPSISPSDPPPGDFVMSPWWTASLPYKHDGGLVQKLKMAEANGVSAREWGRLTSAIKEDWSTLAYLLEIELAEPVYGWFGGFKGMSRKGGGASKRDAAVEGSGKTGLPGGGTQFYIPNLPYSAIASHTIKPL
ncbi:hypothetical protein [Pseudosulfitobacter sp. SM2401]|uniref:hypothetical protein n=1 Tax=Pseudosulfitobacter sp. SM2401 TaxID=3350098 RepID=UPI0036F43F13